MTENKTKIKNIPPKAKKEGKLFSLLQYEISRILNESKTTANAIHEVLPLIGKHYSWDYAGFWIPDKKDNLLKSLETWSPWNSLKKFSDESRRTFFRPGEGLPGYVWSKKIPKWIPDLGNDPIFIRFPAAKEGGLVSGLAYPIMCEGNFLGIFEFFSRDLRDRDESFLTTMEATVNQIGQFWIRCEAESSLQNFRHAVEQSPSSIIITDTSGNIEFVNRGFVDTTGYSREEVLGQNPRVVQSGQTPKEIYKEMWDSLRAGKTWRGQLKNKKKNGEFYWEEAVISPVKDARGNIIRYISIQSNITQRKNALENLKKERDIMSVVMDNTKTEIAYMDRDFNFVMVNSAFERSCGRSNIIGKNYFDLFPNRENLEIFRAVRDSGETKEFHSRPIEFTNHPQKGITYWNWVLSPIKNNEGEVTNLVLSMTDITDAKKIEERQRNFLAMLGHELRNPLAPIILSLDLIGMKNIDDPEVKQSLDIIKNQTNNMAKLLKDLLDISRIERGKIDLDKKEVSFTQIMKNIEEAVRPIIAEKKQHIKFNLLPSEVKLMADATRIEQIFVNLIGNASKFSKEKAIINVRAEKRGKDICISVEDKGVGMSPKILSRIFDLFVQIDLDKKGGLGIGLYLARSLAQLHGGDIAAYSPGLGKGSEFIVKLPILERSSETNGKLTDTSSKFIPAASHIKVVVADDNVVLAENIGKILKMLNYEVKIATDGTSAIEMVNKFRPDIALIDLGMPDIDGLEVARRVRASNGSKTTLIAITGYGQESDKRKAKEAGFDYYIIKPVGIEALSKVLALKDSDEFRL